MNLKTSLKTVILTLFDLKMPVLGLLMLLFCITACNEHEVLPPSDSPAESLESFEALNLSAEEADFFSDEKINEMPHLKQTVEQLNNDIRGRSFFARSIQKTKRFVRNMNLQMGNKYIPHITQNVGHPVWLASYVAKLEGGDMMTFVPLVPADEAMINGVLIYSKTADGEASYSLTTREQMTSVETETNDQNFPLLVQMFYEFDKQLFNAGTEAYLDWGVKPVIELEDCSTFPEYTCLGRMTELPNRVITLFDTPVFDSTPLPDFGTEFPCYYICDAGCTADIYAAGIADEEDIAWINGNCSYADVIDDFLADNDEPEIGQILLDVAIFGYLTQRGLISLTNAIEDYLNDPANANTDAACVVQEVLNGLETISPSAVDLMNQAYVADVYSLPASFPVADIESELLADLVYLYCSQLVIDACTGLPIPTSTITNILVNSTNPSNPNTSYSDFYAELSVYDYIDTGILGQFTLDGNPFDYSELPILCNDNTLPDCTGCSVGQQQELWLAYIEARNKLECAIDMLNEYDGSTGDVSVHLATHFAANDKGLAEFISSLLTYIKIASTGADFVLTDNAESSIDLCNGDNEAWTFPLGMGFTDIRLCYPNFWDASEEEQAKTLIHEYMHLYFLAGDIAYQWQSKYRDLSTTQSIYNADSYSELAGDMCP